MKKVIDFVLGMLVMTTIMIPVGGHLYEKVRDENYSQGVVDTAAMIMMMTRQVYTKQMVEEDKKSALKNREHMSKIWKQHEAAEAMMKVYRAMEEEATDPCSEPGRCS